MHDLLSATGELNHLQIPDAEIYYRRKLPLGAPYGVLLRRLIENVPWRVEDIVAWSQSRPQPRLVAWFGDEGTRYTYSDISLEPLPWWSLIEEIRAHVEAATQARFNSVLLNCYRNHRDGMSLRSDDEPELGRHPIIASVHLGESRTFVLEHKTHNPAKTIRLDLESGSLLLMKGATQHHWKHGIDQLERPCGPHVSLTFRRIFSVRGNGSGTRLGRDAAFGLVH